MPAGSRDEMLRAARNQTLYREVNERIQDLSDRFEAALDAGATWVCECADAECSQQLELTLGEYEQLRAHSDRFAVTPGHAYQAVERVVEEHESYLVVEKLGVGATYAADQDPRGLDRGGCIGAEE